MFQSDSIFIAPLSRSALYIGAPLAFIALTSFFIAVRFPYGAIFESVNVQVEEALNIELQVEDVGVSFSLFGPGFEFESVRTRLADGMILDFDSIFVRPAWSFSWFTGDPSIFLDVEGPLGSFFGTIRVGDEYRWDGSMQDVDLEALPIFAGGSSGFGMTGWLSAEGDIRRSDAGVSGDLTFEIKDGSVTLEGLPMGLPYETLAGQLEMGGEHRIAIESLALDGPMLGADITGTVGQAESFGKSKLDLVMKFRGIDPNLAPLIKGFGASVSPSGESNMKVGGTWSNPTFQ